MTITKLKTNNICLQEIIAVWAYCLAYIMIHRAQKLHLAVFNSKGKAPTKSKPRSTNENNK